MTRLLIAEDQPDEAANIARLMGSLLQVETQTVPDVTSLLALLDPWKPDVTLLDLCLLGSTPDDTINAIPEIVKRCPVVVFTGQAHLQADNYRKRCIRNGARSFVQKDHVGAGGWQMLAAIVRDAFLAEWSRTRKATQPLRVP